MCGGVLRPAARQHPDHVEVVEGQDRRQHDVDRRSLADRRQHHVEQPPHRPGAVDGGRLDLLLVDVLQRREIDHRRERKALPDGGDDRRAPSPSTGSASQACASIGEAERIRNELIRPSCGSYMNRHRIAATTPGSTQGSSTSERISPCVGSRWLSRSAIRKPTRFCSSTTTTVQTHGIPDDRAEVAGSRTSSGTARSPTNCRIRVDERGRVEALDRPCRSSGSTSAPRRGQRRAAGRPRRASGRVRASRRRVDFRWSDIPASAARPVRARSSGAALRASAARRSPRRPSRRPPAGPMPEKTSCASVTWMSETSR